MNSFDFTKTALGDTFGNFLNQGLKAGEKYAELRIEKIRARNGSDAAVGVSQLQNAVGNDGAPIGQPRTAVMGIKTSTLLVGGAALALGLGAAAVAYKK